MIGSSDYGKDARLKWKLGKRMRNGHIWLVMHKQEDGQPRPAPCEAHA